MRVREAMARNPTYCTQAAPFSIWRDHCVVGKPRFASTDAQCVCRFAVAARQQHLSLCGTPRPVAVWSSELSFHVVGAKVTLVTAVPRKVLSHLTRHDEERLVFKALVVRPESVSVVVFLHVHHLFNQKLGYLIRRDDPDAIDSIVFLRAFH